MRDDYFLFGAQSNLSFFVMKEDSLGIGCQSALEQRGQHFFSLC